MRQKSTVENLKRKITDLREREQSLDADLRALQQGVMGLMTNRPTTFPATKIRDWKIRKATQALNEGKEALKQIKMMLQFAEVELRVARDADADV